MRERKRFAFQVFPFRRVTLPALGAAAALSLVAGACQPRETPSIDLARQAWDRGEYAQAAQAYESLLAHSDASYLGEDFQASRFELANTYHFNLRDHAAAARHYSRLLEDLSESPRSELARQARRRLAEVQVLLKQPREAINQYETLLLLFPDQPERRETRFTVAELYYDQGDYNQAATEFQRVVEGAPYDALAEKTYQRLAGINHHLQKKYDDAIQAYRILAEKTFDDAIRRNAKIQTSDCLARLLRYEEATDALQNLNAGSEAERVEIRNRIRVIRKQRQAMNQSADEINWTRKP